MDSYKAGKLGAHTNIVLLSPQTVAKQESKHKQRDLSLYRLAETIITKGELFRESDNSLIALWSSPPDARGKIKLYKAFVRATRAGHEIYLRSVHRTSEGRCRNIRRAHKPL